MMLCALRVEQTLSVVQEVQRYKGIVLGNNATSHMTPLH